MTPGGTEGLVLLGAGGFAEDVIDIVSDAGTHRVEAAVDDAKGGQGRTIRGRPILTLDEASELASDHAAICTVGTTPRHDFLERVREAGFEFATVQHPSAQVAATADVDAGSLLGVHTVIAASASIGEHVILNRGAMVGHHTAIGDRTTLSPGANVAGRCTVGSDVYIGMDATVLNDIEVGHGSVVGAGAVVIEDVPANVQVLGTPARITKEGIEGIRG